MNGPPPDRAAKRGDGSLSVASRSLGAIRRRHDRMMTKWVDDHAHLLRNDPNPMRPFEILDRILLPEFAERGARTRQALVESSAAASHELREWTVSKWMEAARRRGVLDRGADARDIWERPLPAQEWVLTDLGRERARKFERLGELRGIVKVLLAFVPVIGFALTVARASGVERLPGWALSAALWVVAGVALLLVLALLPGDAHDRALARHAVALIEERGDIPR